MTTTPPKQQRSDIIEYQPFGEQDKIKLSCSIIRQFVANPTRSGKLPEDRECVKFMMMCQAKRLNPFAGDAFLIGYDGKSGPEFSLITAHQTYLKRAEVHPEYDGMDSGVIVETEGGNTMDLKGDYHADDQKVLGGWATVHFKTRSHPMCKRLRLSRFRKPFGVWNEDPAGMIVKCAEADALRSAFPSMLGGLYMREEMSFFKDTEVMTPKFDTEGPIPEAATRRKVDLFAAPPGSDVDGTAEPALQTEEAK